MAEHWKKWGYLDLAQWGTPSHALPAACRRSCKRCVCVSQTSLCGWSYPSAPSPLSQQHHQPVHSRAVGVGGGSRGRMCSRRGLIVVRRWS